MYFVVMFCANFLLISASYSNLRDSWNVFVGCLSMIQLFLSLLIAGICLGEVILEFGK